MNMSKKSFIVRASVIAFAVLSIVFFKPTDVKAYNSGCDIVSPSTMAIRYNDQPSIEYRSWDGWKSYYAGLGYTYIDSSSCSVPQGYSGGNLKGWWMHLRTGSTDCWVLTYEWGDQYAVHKNSWRCVNESTGGVYYYADQYGRILTNTWAHIRVSNEAYQPTDAHGYFVFNSSGRMCTGWHKDSNGRWYYTRIDHTNNTDGPSMKVGESSGFDWATVKDPTTYSEGLYYFTGINVNTNVYIEDTSGKFTLTYKDGNETKNRTSTVKYSVGDGTGQVKPLATKTVSPNTDYVGNQYDSSYFYIDTSHKGSWTDAYNFTISNGDYTEYEVTHFNYYIARNTYTMTLNHYKYNVSTGKYDDKPFKTETVSKKYGTTYTPAYTTAPTGYFTKSRDCDSGWTVTGNKTFSLYYYPNSYTQTINFYKHTASGTYTGPTYTDSLLGTKTYSALYSATFNAYSNKAAWGNVAGCHWWKIDKYNNTYSWTVEKAVSLNSYYYPNTYRLIIDLNNGTDWNASGSTNAGYNMEYGTSISLAAPTRDGYSFNGWEIVVDNSNGSSLSDNVFTMGYNRNYPYQDYTVTETVRVQARWIANTYTLRFDGNGADSGSVADMTVSYDSDISLPLNGYALDRNTFAGWTLDSSAHVGAYFAGQNILSSAIIDAAGMSNQNNAVITLYCAWDPAANISVKNKSFTLEEARNGLITEEQLFEDAYAMDDILDREILPGTHDLGDGRTNSFTITNYSPEEFPQFTDSGSNTITYQVIDSVGNVTEKTITVYIVNNAPQEPESGEGTYRVRFISEKYYDKPEEEGGLMKDSVWRINPEYAELLRK